VAQSGEPTVNQQALVGVVLRCTGRRASSTTYSETSFNAWDKWTPCRKPYIDDSWYCVVCRTDDQLSM